MHNLTQLVQHCKCGVYVTVNAHRDNYQTASQHLEDLDIIRGSDLDITPEVRAIMAETDTIVNVQFYQHTPVSFNEVYHYDLDKALQLAVEMLDPGEKPTFPPLEDVRHFGA